MVMSAQHIEIDIVDGVAQVTLGRSTLHAVEEPAVTIDNAEACEASNTAETHADGGRKNRWRLVISGGRLATWRFDGQKYTYYWRGATYFGGLRIYDKDRLELQREIRVPRRWKADLIIDELEAAQ